MLDQDAPILEEGHLIRFMFFEMHFCVILQDGILSYV
jgi:hypothetical protein